jgi:hypothetical protein
VHFQQLHCIVKEITSTSAFPTTTLHHGGKLVGASLPYTTSSSALTKKRMHHERHLAHASIPSIISTNAFLINTLHHEGSLADTGFPSDTSTLSGPGFLLAQLNMLLTQPTVCPLVDQVINVVHARPLVASVVLHTSPFVASGCSLLCHYSSRTQRFAPQSPHCPSVPRAPVWVCDSTAPLEPLGNL